MSYQFYSFLHLFFLVTIFTSLGAIVFHNIQGGTKDNLKNRKQISAIHGIGLLVVLVSGFGMMARAQFTFSSSPWLFVKLGAWLLIGVFPTLVYKRVLPNWTGLIALFGIAGMAIYFVVNKPI